MAGHTTVNPQITDLVEGEPTEANADTGMDANGEAEEGEEPEEGD